VEPTADTTVTEIWALCRVPKTEIYHLRYTLEAYEGLCVPTTLPGGGGFVRLLSSGGLRAELGAVLEALAGEIGLEVLEWGEGPPADETTPRREEANG